MQIHRDAVEVVIHTPAKLNLFFEVLGKRSDGYHEIETLMCPVAWYDTLCFEQAASENLELECQWGSAAGRPPPASGCLASGYPASGCRSDGSGFEDVPRDGKNLVVRAVDLVRRRTGIKQGARLRLIKRIPAAAGLGGGSSDAAAALAAANMGWKLGLSLEELAAMAAELGSDVPFFLHRGAAVCRGRGERIEAGERAGSDELCGRATAARPGDCRRVRRLPAAVVAAAAGAPARCAAAGKRSPGRRPVVQSTPGRGRTVVAVDRQAGRVDGRRGQPGTRHERQWDRLFRAVSQRLAGAARGPAVACPEYRLCGCCAELQLELISKTIWIPEA